MRWLLSIVFLSVFTVSAADLEAELKAGEALLDSLPKFVEGPLKSVLFESRCNGEPSGYGEIKLSAVKTVDELTLRYETHGVTQLGSLQTIADTSCVLDTRFRLKAATLRYTVRLAPRKVPERIKTQEEEILVENGRVRARTPPATEWKEYPLDYASAVWPAAELIQWIKFGDVTSFAFRQLDPRGRWVNSNSKESEKGQVPEARSKGYCVEAWRYQVVRNDDGTLRVDGSASGYRWKFYFNREGGLRSISMQRMDPKRPEGPPEVTYEMKIVSKERVEELKKLLSQTSVTDDLGQ